MKKIRIVTTKSIATVFSLLFIALILLSCEKEGSRTYSNTVIYNGTTYSINSAMASEVRYMFAGGLHMFYISFGEGYPQEFNYISFDISPKLLKKEYSLAKESSQSHRWNISFFDAQEDSYLYGSSVQMRDIVSGTLYIKNGSNNLFDIELSITTADRKNVSVSYKGVVTEYVLLPEERAKIITTFKKD